MTKQCSLISLLKNYIILNKSIGKFYSKSFPNSKYSLGHILGDILYVLKYGVSQFTSDEMSLQIINNKIVKEWVIYGNYLY